MSLQEFPVAERQKRVAEVLDYDFDFTDFLSAGNDTVSSAAITALPTGLTLGAKSQYTTIVKQWISGGTDGAVYSVMCLVTTTLGRQKKLELKLTIKGA